MSLCLSRMRFPQAHGGSLAVLSLGLLRLKCLGWRPGNGRHQTRPGSALWSVWACGDFLPGPQQQLPGLVSRMGSTPAPSSSRAICATAPTARLPRSTELFILFLPLKKTMVKRRLWQSDEGPEESTLSSGKAGEGHFPSIFCPWPIGVNTGQGEHESEWRGAGNFLACLVTGYLTPNLE